MTQHPLIGRTLQVSLQPYQGGTARVVDVRPSVEYGTDKVVPGHTTIEVEAVDMTETSRLLGAVSTKPVEPGKRFDLHFYDVQLARIESTGRADYVYPV